MEIKYRVVSDTFRGFEVQFNRGDGWVQCGLKNGVNTLSSELRASIYIALRMSGINNVNSDQLENMADKLNIP